MNPIVETRPSSQVRHESLRIGGEKIRSAHAGSEKKASPT
jgi:hypothetical protein